MQDLINLLILLNLNLLAPAAKDNFLAVQNSTRQLHHMMVELHIPIAQHSHAGGFCEQSFIEREQTANAFVGRQPSELCQTRHETAHARKRLK